MNDRKKIEITIDPDWMPLSERMRQMLEESQALAKQIQEAFGQVDMTDTIAQTVRMGVYTRKLSGQLQYLRLSLGRLKAALSDAFAPITAVVLPVINRAINTLVSFLHTVGAVLAAVMDSVRGTDSAAQSANTAAKAYKSLGSAAKKSLAGFDQLERLNGAAGSVSAVRDPLTVVSESMQSAAHRILTWLKPLLQIDLTALKDAFARLWQVVSPLLQKLGQSLQWLHLAVGVPFITWCMESLFPALTDTFASALESVSQGIGAVITGLQLFWHAIEPVVEFIGSAVITALAAWKQVFDALAIQLAAKGPEISAIFYNIGQVVRQIWNVIGPILSALYDRFCQTFSGLGALAARFVSGFLESLYGITEFLAGIFSGNWSKAWNGILYMFKGIINSLIGLMNAMLARFTGTLNNMIRAANALKFRVPDWVPGIGGQAYQLNMKTVTTPQIPYLAKGAVLPANRPFLAMVGDQRHGTNIEAPLATIEQAVAGVMGDYAAADRAGHQATADLLRQILEAVLGISVGDDVIAGAVSRYQAKLAVVRGG